MIRLTANMISDAILKWLDLCQITAEFKSQTVARIVVGDAVHFVTNVTRTNPLYKHNKSDLAFSRIYFYWGRVYVCIFFGWV